MMINNTTHRESLLEKRKPSLCPKCGTPMVSMNKHVIANDNRKIYVWYICPRRKDKGESGCGHKIPIQIDKVSDQEIITKDEKIEETLRESEPAMRKKAEGVLKRAYKELESQVAKYTAELLDVNKQLNQEMLERRKIERQSQAGNTLLSLLNKMSSRKEYLDAVVEFISTLSGCRCVGIRVLNEEGMIPYESHTGFSQEFLKSENLLSVTQDQCTCVRVITGKRELQDASVMTPAGSFRCDNIIKFMFELSEQDKAKVRGVCMESGFASVAIIPIQYNNKILGAIHLADENERKIPLNIVESIELLTPLISEGIYKFNLADDIHHIEKRLNETNIAERKRFNEKLVNIQKELEKAKRLSYIGTFTATVVHELRNPLGVIFMAAYNIKKKNRDPSINKHISNIEKKITESDRIINNLLTYSRIKTPSYEKTQIYKILNACISSAKKRFHEQDVSINKKIKSIEKKFINADPFQITEIFNNILDNAYQSISGKKVEIEIIAELDDNEGTIRISFKDNGLGIDKEDLKNIFDPFFTTGKSTGTGLGLAICNELVNLHDGKIDIETEKGNGTIVTISLPIGNIKNW